MSESRTKNSVKNIYYSVFFIFVKTVLKYGFRLIFLNTIGIANTGVLSVFTEIGLLLTAAESALATLMMVYLYKPFSENAVADINKYYILFKRIFRIILAVSASLSLLFIPFLKYAITETVPHLTLIYLLIIADTLALYYKSYSITLLTANQKDYVTKKIDIIKEIVFFVFETAVCLITKNFILYLVTSILITLFSGVYKNIIAKKSFSYLSCRKKQYDSAEAKKILKKFTELFIIRIGYAFNNSVDMLIISIIINTVTAGKYSNYLMIINGAQLLVGTCISAVNPSIGNYVSKNSKDKQRILFAKIDDTAFLVSVIITALLAVLTQDFIKITAGGEMLLSDISFLSIIVCFFVSQSRQIVWNFRNTIGFYKETKYISLYTSIANALLSVVMGYYFGIPGVIFATVVTKLCIMWWLEPKRIYNKYFGTSSKEYFIRYIKNTVLYLPVLCISFIFGIINIPVNPIISMLIKSIIIILLLIVTAFTTKRKMCREIISVFLSKQKI